MHVAEVSVGFVSWGGGTGGVGMRLGVMVGGRQVEWELCRVYTGRGLSPSPRPPPLFSPLSGSRSFLTEPAGGRPEHVLRATHLSYSDCQRLGKAPDP